MKIKSSLSTFIAALVIFFAGEATAGTSFWVYNATNFNTVTTLTPNSDTVTSNVAYEAKSDADGDTMTMEVADIQFTITDTNTQCANVPGSWEMKIEKASGGTNSVLATPCVNIVWGQCGNLGIIIQPTSDGKGVTVGYKDRGSSACGGSFSDWVSWIKTGVSIVSTIASL